MRRSSGSFLSYDLRPAKQSERRILLDLLKVAGDCGLRIGEYRYVGMGANRFYDFLLIHKYLGLSRMVSLERDPTMFKRAEFNCPYSFIEVRNTTVADFIAVDTFDSSSILWFDYDGGLDPTTVADISSLSIKLKVGDLCFVTVNAAPTGTLSKRNGQDRLTWLQDELGDVAAGLTIDDVQESTFANAVHKVLLAAFQNAFVTRRDGTFVPFLQVRYSDSMPMITVGGGLFDPKSTTEFLKQAKITLPFLHRKSSQPYEIKSLHLTERERAIFDRATTHPKKRSRERNQLLNLGFGDKEFDAYKDLIRYLPRYVETIV